ncbi:MAG: peptide chain release factor N(5)-glutamine methyltransferase [Bacilli bacterium]|nr:peptide chain release factor N(5)-glutamine methyltransferase [Bacilli bacterium]
MKVDDLIVYGKSKVHSDLAKMLLADLMDINSLELLTILDREVSSDIEKEYKFRVDELRKGRPIQYIIGNVNFCGNILEINENVLIPRFETEQLVVNTVEKIKELWPNQSIDLIDLGTGSGAIGLSIKKKLPNVNVTLLDISEKALEVAKKNATNLNINVKYILNDMLENLANKYDVIVSNPPYIKTNEEIEDIVKNNEPHLALYAGDDGLDCYRKILSHVKENINNKYLIAFEIGDTQKEDLYKLAEEFLTNYNIECVKDFSSRDRMIFIWNK